MANIVKLGGGSGGSSTLITKSITQNGTYLAQDDNADGYSEVSVDVSGGSPQTQFRYLKWHITDNGVNNNVLQIAEVEFRNENDVAFTMPTGFTATSSMPPFVPEDDVYVLFDGTDRKLVILPWVSGTSVEDITIDLGAGNYLDISEYPYFCWKAGNDDNQYVGRAPRVWQLYGANQSDFSDAVVLDNTTVPVNTQNGIWCYKSRMILTVIDSGSIVQNLKLNEGKIATQTGEIVADSDYYYTDEFDMPSGNMMFDMNLKSNQTYDGLVIYDDNGDYNNYWNPNARFRVVDMTPYYQAGYKCRLSFRKSNIDYVMLRDYNANILYTTNTPVVIGNEHYRWQNGLIPVSLASVTHNVETNRTFSVADNTITSAVSAGTYCTGVVTLPVSAFTKDEFILEYDIGTPSYSSPQYFARAVFSDNPPSSTWITDEGYGYTALTQSTTAWTGLMQRFTIPQGAQYFSVELGVTNFSAIKFWED